MAKGVLWGSCHNRTAAAALPQQLLPPRVIWSLRGQMFLVHFLITLLKKADATFSFVWASEQNGPFVFRILLLLGSLVNLFG